MDQKVPQPKARTLVVRLIMLLLMLSATQGQSLAQDRLDIVPPGWHPSLQEPLAFLEEEANAKTQLSQQFLNRNSSSLAALRDAQLFITYISLMQLLDKPGRQTLFEEQRDWLKQRQEQAKAAIKSAGGSLQPLEYNRAFQQMTEARLAALRKRLQKNCSKNSQK